jgi:hypothetical protein
LEINVESLDRLYLPEPPTPRRKAFPRGFLRILQILDT